MDFFKKSQAKIERITKLVEEKINEQDIDAIKDEISKKASILKSTSEKAIGKGIHSIKESSKLIKENIDSKIDEEDIINVKNKITKRVSKVAGKTAHVLDEGYEISKKQAKILTEQFNKSREPVSESNWYYKAAVSCEELSDAILHEYKGTSSKIVKGTMSKVGFAGTSVGIFSIASILGTASTGTAIGSLSGAAFTNASLAWIGGSVAMGSIIIGAASIAGGIGAILGTGWVFKKYIYGEKRKKSSLEQKEQNIVDACLALAVAFREQDKSNNKVNTLVAKSLYQDALKPLKDDLVEYQSSTEDWKVGSKRNFNNALDNLKSTTEFIKTLLNKNPNITIGVVSSVIIQLLSDSSHAWDENELIVLDALRRSKNDLVDATEQDLSNYVQSLEPEQISGLVNNIKGIYHELRFANEENADTDEYIIELFKATNHPGADVKIINTLTGDIKEVQLKATDYLSYVKKHNEKYENIDVFATSEVASQDPNITSTGISNEELTQDTNDVIEQLDDISNSTVASSMTVAAMITLSRNVKVLLRSEQMSVKEKTEMTKDGLVAAGTAGLVALLLG